ncbi:jg9000 [Pararge aegeria aegeria]|uniref:Jg9000 protein n=1 Tax=Pararge aegeria aegeria TaxID=348720 RepID=A0A8S4SQ57_9NEOP|nr:jg9000 [Pararge aegeria aegeria]
MSSIEMLNKKWRSIVSSTIELTGRRNNAYAVNISTHFLLEKDNNVRSQEDADKATRDKEVRRRWPNAYKGQDLLIFVYSWQSGRFSVVTGLLVIRPQARPRRTTAPHLSIHFCNSTTNIIRRSGSGDVSHNAFR